MDMRFSPEQLAGLPESSDRRARARRIPSALTSIEIGESNGGIVLNVSETGIAIAVAQSMAAGRTASLSFRLPQLDRTFRAGGEIVWLSESKKTAGVRFVNLEARDRAQIRNWIRAEIVAAELQTPPRESASPAAPKPVLVMPAGPKAVRQEESEAERDEARAAEFDRMFPSEASLKIVETPAEPEFNLLAATTEDEDVALAAEAFLAAREADDADTDVREAELGPGEIPRPEAHGIEPEERGSEAEVNWREVWERQFRLEHENLERTRSFEMFLELPAPFSAGFADAPLETPFANDPFAADNAREIPAVEPAPAETGFAAARYAPAETALRASGTRQAAGRAALQGSGQADVARTKNKNSPLSIAALCTVLVAMCFVLGYAIQPGAFRFRVSKSADMPGEAAARNGASPSSEESAATSAAPVSVVSPKEAPSADAASNSAEGKKESAVSAEKESKVVSAKNPKADAADKLTTGRSALPAASAPASTPLALTTAATVAANSSNANSQPAAATAAPHAVAAAAIPVSFFPVTAPSAGKPAKLMQLPEETIAETSSIVIRSRQFLFVPAQAGLESEHPLERVHLGDRILKVTPAYPAQAWEKFQGGTVHLRSTVGPDGTVLDVQAISGPTSLIPAVTNAVRQWRYKPTDIDGRPISIEEDILVEFRPSRETATQ
jgi:TonB family protein